MNLVRNAIVVLAMICLTGSNAATVNSRTMPACNCLELDEPVCDTNGVTYSDMCIFICARDLAKRSGSAEITLMDGTGKCY